MHFLFPKLSSVILPLACLAATWSQASTVSYNTGSLGSAGDGTNAASVVPVAGVVAAGGDMAALYDESTPTPTVIPYQSAVNPPAAAPFTIEFWAMPNDWDNDDAPVSNRISSGNRSGWVFFQRDEAVGWNLRMYNGVGGGLGWDLTGGTSTRNAWSHVVATWDGSAAQLYVNGVLADNINDPAATGVYNASTAANLIVGSSDSGSPYLGSVDEVAFYGVALTPAQILNHFNTVSSGVAGAYHSLIQTDGAVVQLSNNAIPEPSVSALLVGLAGMAMLRRKR